MLKHLLAILILISACHLGPARAQDAAAPFDGDLQRLAEILGTLHYLRGICGTNEGPKWRNEMQALIDAETPPTRIDDGLLLPMLRDARFARSSA